MVLILKLLEAAKDPVKEVRDTEGLVYDRVCANPKCISAVEQELPHIAKLTEDTYRCIYCEKKV